PAHSWIDRPIFGEDGEVMQKRGVVDGEPGLYFVGLHFLYALSSTMIHGVGRDAEFIAKTIAGRITARPATASSTPPVRRRPPPPPPCFPPGPRAPPPDEVQGGPPRLDRNGRAG